jgi:uncharacterized protein YcaQ
MSRPSLSLARARRIALAAQGFNDPLPAGKVDVRHFRRVLDRVKIVQLDSVNVLARAHYLPFFSRLGPYSRPALDGWLWRSGELFEYWAHEASLVPIGDRPLFAARMDGGWHWPGIERMKHDHPGLIERVLAAVRESGPLQVGHIDGQKRSQAWWGWSDTKLALEYLFLTGKVTVADRPNFTRMYEVPDRVHPAALELPPVDPVEARKEMLRRSISAIGVGTATDLADYFRLRVTTIKPLIAQMAADGELVEARVAGWDQPAFLDPSAVAPRRIAGSGFLSPFDPVVWFRPRTERLFDFHYRIEIYTPSHKRIHGYYVLPYRLGDRLVGRADLKADRKGRRLLVQGAFNEPGEDAGEVAASMAADLESMAAWLELDEVVVESKGNLAPSLSDVIG